MPRRKYAPLNLKGKAAKKNYRKINTYITASSIILYTIQHIKFFIKINICLYSIRVNSTNKLLQCCSVFRVNTL